MKMNSRLLSQLNILTDGKFDYLRLKSIDIRLKANLVEVNFVYPEDKEKEVLDSLSEITSALTKVLDIDAEIKVNLLRNHFDRIFFKEGVARVLKKHPFVNSVLDKEEAITIKNDGNILIAEIIAPKSACDYLAEKVIAELDEYARSHYTDIIKFEIAESSDDVITERVDKAKEYEKIGPEFDFEGGRSIPLTDIVHLLGNPIKGPSAYICDIKSPRTNVVLAGVVSNYRSFARKPKSTDKYVKKYFKFVLEDPTGTIECVVFPKTKPAQANLETLANGDVIVTEGVVEPDDFRGGGRLSYIARNVSRCSIPTDFKPNILRRSAPSDYIHVKPGIVTRLDQATMFEEKKKLLSEVADTDYVVFDLETTGLDPMTCKIIEIGAVKISKGEMTATFQTLINPFEHLTPKITEITGLTDDDLTGKLSIEQVLPDFFKFCEGSTIIAHNLNFDFGFIKKAGESMHFIFDHPKIDTLKLAHQKLPKLQKYNLAALCEYFKYTNQHAHRALSDAMVTAQIFLRLMETE